MWTHVVAVWLAFLSVPALARGEPRSLNAADLEPFLDGLLPSALERADIAGAVVAVVKDGRPLLMKGYGYADVERKIPVSADSTLFRPGSISKLFAWTAVMQQVEAGRLDLDRDINQYLDFAIPPAFGKPITLRDLMTHRPGFEETVKDLAVGSPEDLTPLSEYLPAHIPARIFPAGAIPAYSNYGCTLAAYIVERVSGLAFDDYVERHIFQPLGMNRATFRQPVPAGLAPSLSRGYDLASGGAKPFEIIEVAPAGALSVSAESMTRFMIAHLHGGRYRGARILQPSTAETMHARQEGWPDPMNGMALGFYEQSRNGHRILAHGGDTDWFHSDLYLILDADVGLFLSMNSAGRPHLAPRRVLFEEFMDRYFPANAPEDSAAVTALEQANELAGLYKVSRRFETNLLALGNPFAELKFGVDRKDMTVYSKTIKKSNGQPRHFREVAPMLFRAVDGPEQLYLAADPRREGKLLFIDYPFLVFEPVTGVLENRTVNIAVLGFSLGVIVLTLLGWPIGAMVRRHFGRSLNLSPGTRRLRTLVFGVCVLDVAFCAGMVAAVARLESAAGLGPRGDLWLHLLQGLGLLGGAGALIAVANSIVSWLDRDRWFWTKIWYTMVAMGCAGLFGFLFYWHVFNFNLRY